MTINLEYPSWQEPLTAAILEFNSQQLCEKLQNAENAIARRIQELRFAQGNELEVRLLHDAVELIQVLKKDRRGSCTSEK